MRTIILYLSFAVYMLLTFFKMLKLKYLKKHSNEEKIQRYINKIVINWANFTLRTVGIKVNKKGLENIPKGTCLFVANHQGLLDIPVVISSLGRPVGFVAKKEMLKAKILTYWMRQIKCVFIDRQNVREAIKTINEGIKNLQDGYDMLIFPEGTRSRGEKLGVFKKGSMKLATKAKVPVVPITIDGTYKAREANNGWIKPAEVNFIVGKPIYVENLSREQQGNLSEEVRNIIQNTLDEIRK